MNNKVRDVEDTLDGMRHQYGELYPEPNPSRQRRYVRTVLHRECGGLVLRGNSISWKTIFLSKDEALGCCRCKKQPLTEEETYEDYV